MTLEMIWGSGCPYAWRVLLTLEVKGLSYESRLIQFSRDDQRTPEHLALSPRGKVPVLRDCDYVLTESRRSWPISTASNPGRRFRPPAEETGLMWKAISEFQSYVLPLAERIVVPAFGGRPLDMADMQAAAGELHGELGRLEQAVSARGWLAVERLSAADLAVYPFVEALLRAAGKEAVRPMGLGFLPLAERCQALEDWRQRVMTLPGYTRTCPPHWRETT